MAVLGRVVGRQVVTRVELLEVELEDQVAPPSADARQRGGVEPEQLDDVVGRGPRRRRPDPRAATP
ncbi:hypothetical protein BE18_08360 [Sorangium cellulosum]|uniref:Uncharacterized protein n=1 Tax=Sorangium cellulosum TaxID=56 RepID=A0A150R779_SORCE|nr:hypothetical protein BE18_08360 [Sorangium cellulosum]